MNDRFPSAEAYAAEQARHPALTLLDVQALQKAVTAPYRNDVLSDVNDDCVRLAVFEGEYRWHRHPDSDELFLVVEGRMQIEFTDHDTVDLAPWQAIVVPADTVHRTRAIGRTVNLTFERKGARTVFVDA